MVEWAVPNSCMVDKNQERYLRSKGSQPQTRPHSPGFQHREISPHNIAVKNQWGLEQQKKIQDSQETPLTGYTKVLGLTDIHPVWDSAPGQQLEGHQWHAVRK